MAGYLGSVPVPQATQHRESFTCTEGQTSFATAGYTPQFVDVYLNGSHLSPADFTASNGSDVVLGVAASADDVCDIVSYTPFEVANQTFTGTTTMTDVVAASLDISGNIDIDGTANLDNVDVDGSFAIQQANSNTPTLLVQAATTASDFSISGYSDASGSYYLLGANNYLNSGGNFATWDGSENTAGIFLDSRGTAGIEFYTGTGTGTLALSIKNDGNIVIATGSDLITNTASGTTNTRIGTNAGDSIVASNAGVNNVLIGVDAGTALDSGDSNIAIGYRALKKEDDHANNIAIGAFALENQDAGADGYNVAIGYNSGNDITDGIRNVIIGGTAGDQATTIDDCVIIGYNAGGNAAMTGHDNVFIGKDAGQEMVTGVSNVHIGRDSGQASTAGSYNVSIGDQAYQGNQDSDYNVAIGFEALQENTAGNGQNTAVGAQTLTSSVSGYNNTAIGVFSMGNANVTGIHNTGLGYAAGFGITGGSNNTFLGSDSGRSNSPGGNHTTGNNSIVVGNNSSANAYIKIDWTVTSDERDKTDFTALDLGLDFVKSMKPYTFKWDQRSDYGDSTEDDYKVTDQTPDGTHKKDQLDVGFKAQDIEALEKAAGYRISDKTNLIASLTQDETQYGLKYSKFVPILVKAIQEQNALIEALTARVATLEG